VGSNERGKSNEAVKVRGKDIPSGKGIVHNVTDIFHRGGGCGKKG